jgi:hypothetical protein
VIKICNSRIEAVLTLYYNSSVTANSVTATRQAALNTWMLQHALLRSVAMPCYAVLILCCAMHAPDMQYLLLREFFTCVCRFVWCVYVCVCVCVGVCV